MKEKTFKKAAAGIALTAMVAQLGFVMPAFAEGNVTVEHISSDYAVEVTDSGSSVHISTTNKTESQKEISVYLAEYEGGKLKTVQGEPKPVWAGRELVSDFTYEALADGEELKLLVWEGTTPIIKAVSIGTNTPEPAQETVYINEDFNSYESGEIIRSAGNDVAAAPDPVTKGKIVYAAGRRGNGPINNSASIAEGTDGKELVISADSLATSSRGISFSFDASAGVPAVAELGDGEVLEMAFDIKANQNFTIKNFGDVTTDDLTTTADKVRVKAVLDKTANKQYLIVADTSGKLLSSRLADLSAAAFDGMTFYIGAGTFNIDNLTVTKKKADAGIINAVVKDGETALAEADVKIGDAVFKTNASGELSVALPNGAYNIEVSKSGYEHTSGMADSDTKTVTVNSDTQKLEFTLSLQKYVPLPDTVNIKDGQDFIAAPKTSAATQSAAFTVEVIDQFGIVMDTEDYSVTWNIYPSGTEESDANVTIENGVVSVAQSFTAKSESGIDVYDVTAAVFTDDRNNKVTKKIYVGNNDVIYYEDVNSAPASRSGTIPIKNTVTLPAMSKITVDLAMIVNSETNSNTNFALVTDGGKLAGLQLGVGGTIKAWTGWTGNSAMNNSSDVDKFTNSDTLTEGYTNGTSIKVSFTVDKDSNNITVSYGDKSISLPFTVSANTLKEFAYGNYRLTTNNVSVNTVTIQEPDENYLSINGVSAFAKVAGTTVTRNYTLGQSVIVPEETFNWEIAPAGQGVTVDSDGAVSAAESAVAGTYTLTATSTSNAEKTASVEIKVDDYQQITELTLSGAWAYDAIGEKGQYSVVKAVDKYGDDITDLLSSIAWTSSNTAVAEINSATGELTTTGFGETEITATITNGTAVTTKTIPVTVAGYSLTGDASGDATVVDTSALIKGNAIKKYLVTTATADGVSVNSTEVAAADITGGSYSVNTAGAAKYEIAPIFSYHVGQPGTLGNYGAGFDIAIPADTYNFNVTDTGQRCDVYVNNQLIVNNILQGGSAVNSLKVNDIVVNEGVAKITTADYANGQTEASVDISVDIVKSPSVVNREKKMYVLGDSLVCIYYNGADKTKNYQTGWGQVLSSYTKGVEVVNLANSGVTANGLLNSAFTQIRTSAKAGDILVLESGYNDRTYDTEAVMRNALTSMITEAEEKGVEVVLVSPNASVHDYKASVAWTSVMAAVASETGTKYIDLSKLSYDFLYGTYANNTDAIKGTYNVSDDLHSTFNGANKWASMVAKELAGLGFAEYINTDYTYAFTDQSGATIECSAK